MQRNEAIFRILWVTSYEMREGAKTLTAPDLFRRCGIAKMPDLEAALDSCVKAGLLEKTDSSYSLKPEGFKWFTDHYDKFNVTAIQKSMQAWVKTHVVIHKEASVAEAFGETEPPVKVLRQAVPFVHREDFKVR